MHRVFKDSLSNLVRPCLTIKDKKKLRMYVAPWYKVCVAFTGPGFNPHYYKNRF